MADLWKVVVTQVHETTFYVRGDKESAREDADNLTDDVEAYERLEVDTSVDLYPVTDPGPPSGAQVWSGGPKGDWDTVE